MNGAEKDYRIVLLVAMCLIAAVLIVYGKSRSFDFVGFDDELYVTQNQIVQKGISLNGIKWAFTTFHSANWHPLTWLSHMLDCELYGLNSAGHHWTNVEFHIANTLLLFFILFMMTGALWQSAFVAALFAMHPLHVESVAWISERKDVLSTFFGLLSIAAYYYYVKQSSVKYYLLVIALLSLSLMAKPMLVTIPFVLLLIDFWPLNRFRLQRDFNLKPEKKYSDIIRRNFRIILEKIPIFIPVVISCIVTFFAQNSKGAVKPLQALAFKSRVANAFVAYVNYLFKTIWPHKLAVFYPHPENTLPSWQIAGAALLIAIACVAAIMAAKKYPYIAVGFFWYLGTLVPVIGLVQVGDQAMADRYTYIPLIGIFIIVSWGVSDILKKWRYQRIVLSVFAVTILTVFSWRTSLQEKYWTNGITLFEHAIEVTKNNTKAQNNLGNALVGKDIDRAIYHYKEALKINPCDSFALYNLGTALIQKKDYKGATRYLTKVIKLNPRLKDARNNFANILYLQLKPNAAISQYQKILQTDPDNAHVHYNLACVLSSQNKTNEAILHYKEALRVDPKYVKAQYELGNILLDRGKIKEAVFHYAKAIKYKPDYVQVYNAMGLILARQGKYKKAEMFFSKALQLDPEFSMARKNLDIVRNAMLSRAKIVGCEK